MVEKREDTGGSKKVKKMEKPTVVSSNREYLDMDTDEEEFGRQETPEPEEELEIEPDKPVFTEEELNKLVEYVKAFTTLPSFEDSNWSIEVIETIKEYFRNPAKTVLTIFNESNILGSCLEFPAKNVGGLTYFLRSPWQVYTPDNFPRTVIFGSVADVVENSTLKFVENIYAPVAFHSNDWPTVMRNEVFSNLHQFLMCLTDATYNPMGLTILYVPREGLDEEKGNSRVASNGSSSTNAQPKKRETEDDAAEGLIERLERVARYWIRQIREALNGINRRTKSSPCKTIDDEILYWQYRYENMSCIHDQLTNKNIMSIVRKLEDEKSASIKQFNPLLRQVHQKLEEAASNITYLSVFDKFKDHFEIPEGVEEYATRIILLIKFIGTESPFYRGEEKMEKLCRAFGTQAVEHLQRYIDLDVIFYGDPNEGKKLIVESIECCEKIKIIYHRLVDMDQASDSSVISLTQNNNVFNHVDTFVQRCNDLIGIADSRMIFENCEESVRIFGPKAIELDKLYRNIEDSFRTTLSDIKTARNEILDIVSSDWFYRISRYKDEIKNVENMVKNWINEIFDDILNVEEGIEALYGIRMFTGRANLRETLNDKWTQIWKIFGDELESCSIVTKRSSQLLRHSSMPKYAGNANTLRSNKSYLVRQYKMLVDASDWFDDCEAQNAVTKKYKNVLATMTEKEENLFIDWQKHITDNKINPESVLNMPIFKFRQTGKIRTLEVNMEMHYLENLKELTESVLMSISSRNSHKKYKNKRILNKNSFYRWTILNYETKNIFSKNSPSWETLKSRYNKVETMCKLYNSIKESASEQLLSSNLWNELEATINVGFEKTTWGSEMFPRFFSDCMQTVTKIYENFQKVEDKNDP
ncbi:dynein-1-beta heavy chain, flagellar inner arm I1 complex isoform X2 [Venturia canescens]|uniref:dynein-1-beta heavy chain, flagellar inner arm I1 complex isoform X2 n=1 Tax=Venturia canescens TaxID=32260 RepID=UPI001C9CEF1A|nr:dynein-1-beta heavy chain, flagellar inner arm I1 complex isoform X2 [Venturia canescens]